MTALNLSLDAGGRLLRASRHYAWRWVHALRHAGAIEASLLGCGPSCEPERWAAAMAARSVEEARAKRCLARSVALRRAAEARLAAGG